MNTASPLRLTRKETLRLLKKELQKTFPGVKFSVRSGHWSGSDVSWFEGPTDAEVDVVCRKYESDGFDGMTDCRYPTRATIETPEGLAETNTGLLNKSRQFSAQTLDRFRDESGHVNWPELSRTAL